MMNQKKLLHNVAENIKNLGESLTEYANSLFDIEEMELEDFKALEQLASVTKEPPQIENVEKSISVEEVRTVLGQKSQQGYNVQVRELLLKFGAERLSAVKPEQYPELLKEAELIGN